MRGLETVASEHLNKILDRAREGSILMEMCWRERGRVSCTSLFGDLEESRQRAADEFGRPDVDQVVFTATRSVGSTLEVYCEAFDDTGARSAVACAYRKSGLVWKRSGEIHGVESPEPLPETTAMKQSLLDFDGFVQDILANPRRGLFVDKSVQIYLPAHRQGGVDWQDCEAVHSPDEARRLASRVQDTDYFGVVFRSGKSLTIVAWDLTSEARVAYRVPVKKSFLGPIRVSGRPEQLPPPPSL